ncbi:GPR1/FUN34/yaaH family-domain-containing protein [Fennellomyces sp. T-0311]|nr:GPR1/FUN34/yaaH family-domain-containing protein [Fennellomyces sp. T-0311]
MNTTEWTWGAEHPENERSEIRQPKPVRPNQDGQGKLSVPGTPPLSPNYHGPMHNKAFYDYEMMTRSASPLVNGQGSRRPMTMGNPAVIGLWSFATVTILLGCFNLFLPHKPNNIIYPTALLFGGIAQYISGFLDLFYGGTFSGTILVSYGAFWAGSGMMMLPSAAATLDSYANEDDVAQANAIYHFFWAFYTLMLVGVSLKVKAGTFILTCLFWVFITLFLTAIYYLTNASPVLRVSGVSAFLAALGAYYSGVAAIFEEQKQKMWVGKYPWNHKVRQLNAV